MSWAAFAYAQVAGADNESVFDEPGTPAAGDADAPTESSDMYDLPIDQTKRASIFRVEF